MLSGRNKYQSRVNRAEVQDILMLEWDPIGVSGEAGAENEYDGYAAEAYVMLMDGRSAEEISKYLYNSAACHMGLGSNDEIASRSYDVAKRLVGLRQLFQSRLADRSET